MGQRVYIKTCCGTQRFVEKHKSRHHQPTEAYTTVIGMPSGEYERLLERNRILREANEHLQNDNRSYRADLQGARAALHKAENQASRHMNHIHDLDVELDRLEAENSRLRCEDGRDGANSRSWRTEYARLRDENESLLADAARLQARLRTKDEKLAKMEELLHQTEEREERYRRDADRLRTKYNEFKVERFYLKRKVAYYESGF